MSNKLTVTSIYFSTIITNENMHVDVSGRRSEDRDRGGCEDDGAGPGWRVAGRACHSEEEA